MKNERNIKLDFSIRNNDFHAAGQASSKIKIVLQQLDIQPRVIRKIAICSYEAEMNVVIHAYQGHIKASIYPERTELIVSDTGPGIADIGLVMQSGYSTAPDYIRKLGFGSGMGLSTIARYANQFSIQSVVGQGTEVHIVISHLTC